MQLALLYVPCCSLSEAREISRQLLAKKLVACANIIESSSIYNWGKSQAAGKEFIALLKTSRLKSGAAKRQILKMHSYTIPCVIEIPVKANKGFLDWVKGELE